MKRTLTSILTVPELLKQPGYQTALVGKWHPGYSYQFPEGEKGLRNISTQKPYGKFSALAAPVGSKIIDGPIEHGFDEFHGFHHAREMHSWSKNERKIWCPSAGRLEAAPCPLARPVGRFRRFRRIEKGASAPLAPEK